RSAPLTTAWRFTVWLIRLTHQAGVRPAGTGRREDPAVMRLGVNAGYIVGSSARPQLELAKAAEQLGYDSVWVAEAYGSDSPAVLSWIAAQTSRIGIGSAVM